MNPHPSRLDPVLIGPTVALCAALLAGCSCPPPPEPAAAAPGPPAATAEPHHGPGGPHAGPHEPGHGQHEPLGHRFQNADKWSAHFDAPKRGDWQRPLQLLAAMELAEGMTVADLGTGTGYFVPVLSPAVGATGRVLAIDIEPDMVRHVKGRATLLGLTNVTPRLALVDDPLLDDGTVDRILVVNTWHHIPSREAYAAKLTRALKPGGSVWVVDYTMESDIGPPKDHRLAPEVVASELTAAGLTTQIDVALLPKQYVVRGDKTAP
ncbi:MAG: class I SAM-dependent methyltransferase [Deltaproteobacteria bacterium]|nr:class I SAM-dependent methyltransferase [Deltaproteobacteria bacterium]